MSWIEFSAPYLEINQVVWLTASLANPPIILISQRFSMT